ncbi:hypothetical protein BB561_005125 [Smittium simulii]|uniref:Uncharacterized protein n=1 Tax=Smittium simulii TaxID=133385 RepID=A0A2T9YC40_9FUNG|nr:hypothetical protein BB561_005125 [Smittium simulii]
MDQKHSRKKIQYSFQAYSCSERNIESRILGTKIFISTELWKCNVWPQEILFSHEFEAPSADVGKQRANYFGIDAQDPNAETTAFYALSPLQKKDVKECQQNTESRSIVSISKKDNIRSKNKLSRILQSAFYYTEEYRGLEASFRLKELYKYVQ